MEKRPRLSDVARQRLAEMMQRKRLNDCMRIIGLLETKGMDFVVLKGPALAYFDQSRRFEDLDIFVRRGDLGRTAQILSEGFGYRYSYPEELEMMEDEGRDNAHDVSLESPRMIPVELHYRMFNYLTSDLLDPLSGKIYLKGIPCPRPELQLALSLLQNVYHNMFLCDRKRWVRDINIIIGNHMIDWNAFIRLISDLGQAEIAYLAIRILNSGEGEQPLFPKEVVDGLAARYAFSYFRWRVWRWAFCFVRDRLFPPPHLLTERFGLGRDSALFVLTYPANWIRLGAIVLTSPFRR